MIRRLAFTLVSILLTWAGGVRLAEASCASTSIHVSVAPIVWHSDVIPVAWHIDPACAVIETGLLLGRDPAALTPAGQPIYGQRASYEQALPVSEGGGYLVAAYARDEAGSVVQSAPQLVIIHVPPTLPPDAGGSHGPPPFYTGTDGDFLQPAGEPHYASLRRAILNNQQFITVTAFTGFPLTSFTKSSGFHDRIIASTHRTDVLSGQAPPLTVGGVPFTIDPATVNATLDALDRTFGFLGYPRPGLYIAVCHTAAQFLPERRFGTPFCFPFTDSLGSLVYGEVSDARDGNRFNASIRSSATYFIPKPPPGKRVQSAKLRTFVPSLITTPTDDFSVVRLSGKAPTTIERTGCSGVFLTSCRAWVTWDFTEEARALAAQGGGELPVTLDPAPPQLLPFQSAASYAIVPAVNYPWKHGHENGALTLTFEADCPRELKLTAEDTTIRPQIPFGATLRPGVGKVRSMTMIRATVKTCPSDGNAPPPGPIHVAFEVHPPAGNTAEDGGHLHPSTQRPTGTFLAPRLGGGLDNVHCTIETLNEEGMGSCEVPFHSGELSGVETIVGKALDFADAQTSGTIRLLPELKNFRDLPSELYRFVGQIAGRHIDNHWATPATIANTTLMAADYFAANKAVLQINDMSLKWGGLFDIDADWLVPHKAHRQGTSVDVDRLACVSSNPSDPGADCSTTKAIPVKVFKELCTGRHGTRADEGTHHCEFVE